MSRGRRPSRLHRVARVSGEGPGVVSGRAGEHYGVRVQSDARCFRGAMASYGGPLGKTTPYGRGSFISEEGSLVGELTEEVIPVFGGRTQAADGRLEIVHTLGHGIAGGISVKAAIDQQALEDQICKPRWVRPGT